MKEEPHGQNVYSKRRMKAECGNKGLQMRRIMVRIKNDRASSGKALLPYLKQFPTTMRSRSDAERCGYDFEGDILYWWAYSSAGV